MVFGTVSIQTRFIHMSQQSRERYSIWDRRSKASWIQCPVSQSYTRCLQKKQICISGTKTIKLPHCIVPQLCSIPQLSWAVVPMHGSFLSLSISPGLFFWPWPSPSQHQLWVLGHVLLYQVIQESLEDICEVLEFPMQGDCEKWCDISPVPWRKGALDFQGVNKLDKREMI